MTVAMKLSLSEDLIHYRAKILHLIVIEGHKDGAVLPEQVPREIQPWIHHVQPLRVEPAVRFGVRAELAPFGIDLAGVFEVSLKTLV